MGEVYLARHVLMGRACALKVLSAAVGKDSDALSRFNREATNASQISHPNVCAIYDFDLTSDGLVYLAMEYVEGPTLSEVIGREGPLAVDRAALLVGQCAEGLGAAHELGIVHRDLKPDNIMVVEARGRETVKLVDFGIAKAVEGVGGGTGGQRVTKTGFVVGTPEYMSPEQVAGDPLDARSDLYALALVFYRLVTGRLPFEGGSAQETLVKRLTEPPRPLATALPGVPFPAGLQAVMDRALARKPNDRYQSVAAFARALRDVVEGAEAPTRVVERPEQRAPARAVPPTRVATRPRRSRTGLAAVGLLVTAGAALGVWQLVGAPVGSTLPPAPRPDSLGAAVPDSVAGGGKALSNPSAGTTQAVTGDTAAPPAGAQTGAGRATDPDLAPGRLRSAPLPDPEALDNPERRERALKFLHAVWRSDRVDVRRRAEAAYYLGMAALDDNNVRQAGFLFQSAQRLDPRPRYAEMLRQVRPRPDTTG